MEFGVSGRLCPVCNYRPGQLNISNILSSRNQFQLTDLTVNLHHIIRFAKFFKQSARFISNHLQKISTRISTSNFRSPKSPFKLAILKLRGFDKYCGLYKVHGEVLLERLENWGLTKKDHILYLMTDLPQNSKHIRILRHHYADYYFFESRDISFFQQEPFLSAGSYLIYIVEMELLELADAYVTTYVNHGSSNSSNLLGTIAPKSCYRKHKFKPWDLTYKFWHVF